MISACSAAALVRPSFPAAVDPGLERVQLACPPGGLHQQPAGAGLGGEPAHGLPVQAQDAGGLPLGAAFAQELVDGGMALEGTRYQGPLAAAHVPQPVRLGGRRGGGLAGRCAVCGPGVRSAGEAAAVRGDRLLRVLAQVVPQVPAVRDLDSERRAGRSAIGICAGPVPADDFRAGTGLQPLLQRGGLAVGQQVDDLARLGVGHHGAIDLPLAQREVVDPGDLRRGCHHGIGQRHDQPQQRGGMHRDAQDGGQPGTRPPGQLKPETAQHLPQRQGAPQIAGAQALGLLGERHRPAPRVRAAEPAHRQRDQQRPAARRAVCQQPLVAAVHPRRLLPAPRAPRQGAPDRREDHHRIPGVGHPADLQPGKVREQHRQQGRSPLGHLQAANGAIAVCQRRRHDKMKRQRGSRAKRSWQTSASCRSLAAIPRRHAAPAPDRDEPAPAATQRNPSQNSRKSPIS